MKESYICGGARKKVTAESQRTVTSRAETPGPSEYASQSERTGTVPNSSAERRSHSSTVRATLNESLHVTLGRAQKEIKTNELYYKRRDTEGKFRRSGSCVEDDRSNYSIM